MTSLTEDEIERLRVFAAMRTDDICPSCGLREIYSSRTGFCVVCHMQRVGRWDVPDEVTAPLNGRVVNPGRTWRSVNSSLAGYGARYRNGRS